MDPEDPPDVWDAGNYVDPAPNHANTIVGYVDD